MKTSQSGRGMGAHAARRGQPSPASAPRESERISTIRAGQGAKVTTRKNAAAAAERARHNAERRYLKRHPEAAGIPGGPERSGKNVLLLVVAALAGLVLLFFVVRCATAVLTPGPAEQAEQQSQWTQQGQDPNGTSVQEEQDAEDEQAAVDGSVSYQGDTYALQRQESGRWGLVRTSGEDGALTTLFELEGEPVALMRHADTLLVPENRDGGWDIACYVIAAHAPASYITGEDGGKVQGSGSIESVQLDGPIVRVTDGTGATTDVAVE